MLPIKFTSGDREVICPYDKAHVILAKSLNAHLIKCRQNHTNVPMAVCRFDQTHVIPKPEKVHHESECPGQYLLDRERQRRAGDIGLRGDVKGPPIIADHNSAIDPEDWGACPPTRNPALFNKKEPEESVLYPYIPYGAAPTFPVGGQGNTRPNSQRKPSNSLPQTSSMAANVAPPTAKDKQFPSSVFEYTSGYGRGRGKVASRGEEKSSPSKVNIKSPPPKTTPAWGQIEDKHVDWKPPSKQRASDGNNSAGHVIPNGQHPALQQSNGGQLKVLKEEGEQIWHQMQQLRLLHRQEQEKLRQEYQLHVVQFEKKFAEDQQLLYQRQAEQEKVMEERLEQLMASAAASVPTFPTYTYSAPPGFGQSGILSTTSGPADAGVSNETPAAALPVKKEEEAWHEDTSGMNLQLGASNSHANAISVTTSGTLDNVAKWLQYQSIDDIDDHNSKHIEVESPPDSLKTKRKLEKKLRQITVLEQKVSLGHKLSQLEEVKLNQKTAIISQLTTLDCSQP